MTSATRQMSDLPVSSEIENQSLILVVDDEAHIRSLLVQELVTVGYRVAEAATGTDAIVFACHHISAPSLIVLDVMMPDLSGFDVTRLLKADPTTSSIPILILSIVEDRKHGLALGADEYLIKPVEVETLLMAVENLLEGIPSPSVVEP